MRLRRVLLAVLALTLSLTGCAAATPGSSGDGAALSSPEVREAMSDGSVTIDEYQRAFRKYVGCMESAGFSVIENEADTNGVINYSISNDAVVNGADQECYDLHYGPVDSAYQVAHEDSGSSAEFLRACLRAEGITPADTMKGLLEQFETEGLDIGEC